IGPGARVEPCEPAALRAHPEPALRVHVERADEVARQAVGLSNASEAAVFVAEQTVAVGAHPESAVRGFGERADGRRPGLRIEHDPVTVLEARDARPRADPEP